MLTRIFLVIAILAAIAVAVLNFVEIKKRMETLITQRNDWHDKHTKTDAELRTTKSTLDKTTKELANTKEALTGMTAERDKALGDLESANKNIADLTGKLAKANDDLNATRQNLARYEGTGYTPEQIIKFGQQVKDTQLALDVAIEEKKIISAKLAKTVAALDRYLNPEKPVLLPASLKGTIMVTDPKWEFVVLNVGESQGVVEHGELYVSRSGKLVGKVVVRSVQKDRSIANVVPGWRLTDIMEGDQVIAAYPDS